jgi:hypothetical protein
VYKGAHLYNEYPAIQHDHDSWGICTTFAECKIVITAVLTVTSSMDPLMISGIWVGLIWLSRFGQSCWVRSILRSGLCGVIDVPLSRH